MRRFWIVAFVAVIALAGCSASKKVYSSNGTTVTTDTKQNTVTIQSSGGTMKMGTNAVDVAKLGVPIYGGAVKQQGGFSIGNQKGSEAMVAFTTTDPFDKVYTFYKNALPQKAQVMKMDVGGSSVAEFETGHGKDGKPDTVIQITEDKGKTHITITKSGP